jgi:hypothetical protein
MLTFICGFPGTDLKSFTANFLDEQTVLFEYVDDKELSAKDFRDRVLALVAGRSRVLVCGPAGSSRRRRSFLKAIGGLAVAYYLAGWPDHQTDWAGVVPPTKDEGFTDVFYLSKDILYLLVDLTKGLSHAELVREVPELGKLDHLDHDHPKHRETIGQHIDLAYRLTMAAEGQRREILSAVALFHDLGKLYTRKYNAEKGHHTYNGHEDVSACIAAAYWPVELVVRMVKYHTLAHFQPEIARKKFTAEEWLLMQDFLDTDALAKI